LVKLRKLFLRAGERAEVNNMANAKDKRSKKKSRKGRDESRDEMG
jgi:predicted DNA-binding antitoxin AbrB/MazE fold protein